MNKIGAVVVTYNSEKVIRDCLRSLKSNNVKDIVVVDNNSRDKSLKMASQEKAQCIALSSNKGFAAAVNAGVARLNNDFILLLNPDAQLPKNSLRLAQEFMVGHPRVGVAGFLLCDHNNKAERDSFGGRVTLWSVVCRHLLFPRVPGRIKETAWVSGGAMLIRRTVFRQLRGFDDNFFLYWEDVDFCWRVRKAGFKVVIMPSIKVRHARGASLEDNIKKAELYDISADRYFYKHYSKAVWLLHRQLKRFYRFFWRRAR